MRLNKYRKVVIIATVVIIIALVIIAYLCERIDAIFSLLGSAMLVLYAMYEYNLKNEEQIEQLDAQYQAKRYYKFRQALTTLSHLLKRVNHISNKESIVVLSEELTNSLLKNSSIENNSVLAIELLKPENSALLETTISLVRDKNNSVKLLQEYRNNIYSILNTIFNIFPVYSLLLSTLFDLLLFYQQSRTSEKRLLRLLSSDSLQEEISNSLLKITTKITPQLQITSIISSYINNIPSADLKIRQVIVTEKVATAVFDLLDILIDTYIYLNNEQLQIISDNQRLENTDNVSYIFMEACSVYLNKATSDIRPEVAKEIFARYNKLTKLLVDNQKAY